MRKGKNQEGRLYIPWQDPCTSSYPSPEQPASAVVVVGMVFRTHLKDPCVLTHVLSAVHTGVLILHSSTSITSKSIVKN
jgi:hypothetical protein